MLKSINFLKWMSIDAYYHHPRLNLIPTSFVSPLLLKQSLVICNHSTCIEYGPFHLVSLASLSSSNHLTTRTLHLSIHSWVVGLTTYLDSFLKVTVNRFFKKLMMSTRFEKRQDKYPETRVIHAFLHAADWTHANWIKRKRATPSLSSIASIIRKRKDPIHFAFSTVDSNKCDRLILFSNSFECKKVLPSLL